MFVKSIPALSLLLALGACGGAPTYEARGAAIASDLVNLNSADLDELAYKLPLSVDEAKLLVDDRAQNGPFYSIEAIMRIHGIGKGIYKRIRAHVTVGLRCTESADCAFEQSCRLGPDAMPGDTGICLPFDRCSVVRCMAGTHCELGACILDDPCTQIVDGTIESLCGPGERCEVNQVQCVRAPCPPIGTCVADTGCVCTKEYAPVCGVDGTTYGNACEAGCANAAIDYPGACTVGGGCFCPMYFAPVCGVDGKTYSNGCAAGCAKVAIAHTGACIVP